MTVVQGFPKMTSCLRRVGAVKELLAVPLLVACPRAREGDLLVVRATTKEGAFVRLEAPSRRHFQLRPGLRFVGVLANRRSGTNVWAKMPTGAIRAGDRLDVVAVGGLLGKAVYTPPHLGGRCATVEVEGFLAGPTGRVARLDDVSPLAVRPEVVNSGWIERTVFVCGTSAECGKTTLACGIIERLRRFGTVAGVKANGTGRLRDLWRYQDSGATVVCDFVDAGIPTTYAVRRKRFRAILETLLSHAADNARLAIVEIGGDLLEGQARTTLEYARRSKLPTILCTNDAMGALTGIEILKKAGIHRVVVVTLRQNRVAMSTRLGGRRVLDIDDLDELAGRLHGSGCTATGSRS